MGARCPAATLIAALAVLGAASPSAAAPGPVHARVVAPPQGARLPVLLAPDAPGAARRPVRAVTVRGARPVRQASERFALLELRPGDRLTLRLRGGRAMRVELRRSGRADTFAAVAGRLRRAQPTIDGAVAALRPLVERSAEADRDAARDRLTDLAAEVDAVATDVRVTLVRLRGVRPDDRGRRRAAVTAAQRPYAGALRAVADRTGAVRRLVRRVAGALAAGEDIGESGTDTGEPSPLGGGEGSMLITELGALTTDLQAVDRATAPARPAVDPDA